MLQIEQAETNSDRLRAAIYECFDKFGNAEGLCVDCLLYVPQNYQCLADAEQEQSSESGKWVDMSVTGLEDTGVKCQHTNTIKYADLNCEEYA